MLDKQAAVIYRRVTRSANGFAIMKKQQSFFVAGQGTLVPCVFRQTFKQALVAFFVCFRLFSFVEIAFLVF